MRGGITDIFDMFDELLGRRGTNEQREAYANGAYCKRHGHPASVPIAYWGGDLPSWWAAGFNASSQ